MDKELKQKFTELIELCWIKEYYAIAETLEELTR